MPSVEIKILVDALRKQKSIDARLKMLEELPGIENCASSRLHARDFSKMRTYQRTSSQIATVPSGVRSQGQYAPLGRQMAPSDMVSLNDSFLREILVGSGALRITTSTAILFAGSADLLAPEFVSANKHLYPAMLSAAPAKKYRLCVANWGLNFATGARISVSDETIKHALKMINGICDLIIVIAPDNKRRLIKDILNGRSFSEASYMSDFDKIAMADDPGLVVVAC